MKRKAEMISTELWSKALEKEIQKETMISRYIGFSFYELPPPKWWRPAWWAILRGLDRVRHAWAVLVGKAEADYGDDY